MKFGSLKNYFISLMFIIASCKSLALTELDEIEPLPNTRLIREGDKVSLRYYFNIPFKFNVRHKEPLFIKSQNEIIAIFLLREYKKVNDKYIQTFFSVGSDISLKAYLRMLKSRPFYIIDSSERVIKVVD